MTTTDFWTVRARKTGVQVGVLHMNIHPDSTQLSLVRQLPYQPRDEEDAYFPPVQTRTVVLCHTTHTAWVEHAGDLHRHPGFESWL